VTDAVQKTNGTMTNRDYKQTKGWQPVQL